MKTSSGLRLETARLELWTSSVEACRASLRGPDVLARLLGIDVPTTWPPDELEDALTTYGRALDATEAERGWGLWLLVAKRERCLVGSAGFKGRPDPIGRVEVGYGIEPGFRRRGLATEALARLVEWAWSQGVRRIVAECHEDNMASARVLERTGMRPYERRGSMRWWELQAPR